MRAVLPMERDASLWLGQWYDLGTKEYARLSAGFVDQPTRAANSFCLRVRLPGTAAHGILQARG